MAKRAHSHSLSALTEGQQLYLQTRRQAPKTNKLCSSDILQSIASPIAAKRRNIVNLDLRNISSIRNTQYNQKVENSSTERIFEGSYSKSSTNIEKNTYFITDCIANRTRSKTLSLSGSYVLNKEILRKKKVAENLNTLDKSSSSSTTYKSRINSTVDNSPSSSNNLLKYYRKTRKNYQKSTGNQRQKVCEDTDRFLEISSTDVKKIGSPERTSTDETAVNLSLTYNCKNTKVSLPKKGRLSQKKNRRAKRLPNVHQTGDIITNRNKKPNVKINTDSVDEKSYNSMAHQSQQTLSDVGGGQPTSRGELSESSPGGVVVSNSSIRFTHTESETDDNDVGRLQALLEARGLPPHLFGALGPRMSNILHRTIGSNGSSKAQQLAHGLQSQDESHQLQAVIEMCQMLVMGNEDTLAGFPIKQVVPALISLMRMDHNFDIMNNACRALAYMLEALPRSSGTVIEAIPVLLEKLQVIQCMDVAEQSLTALEILSRRHHKAILQSNGVSACLTYLDFFSINAQRAAFSITANCCLNVHPEEFHFLSGNIPLLAGLLHQQDKKCIENICNAFCRLVESFCCDSHRLQEIASTEFLKNCQQLLTLTPNILNTATFNGVIRMLTLISTNCPDLAILLLQNDIASTLLYLLTGSLEQVVLNSIELIPRSSSELFEITRLIEELMPRLPNDDIFIVNSWLDHSTSKVYEQIQWQWRDDRGTWHSYSPLDSQIIDAAHLNSDDEISLRTVGRTYTVDFQSMQQINEETGTLRPIQRTINSNSNLPTLNSNQDLSTTVIVPSFCSSADNPLDNVGSDKRILAPDPRVNNLRDGYGLELDFIKKLFNVLYEVYSSSAGPNVRYKCLRALLRMTYYANSNLLNDVLKCQMVSSHIAGMMGSNDLRIVVGALQMAMILMQKLPETFSVHFQREGVFHQINQLALSPSINITPGTNDRAKQTKSSNQLSSVSNNCLPSTSKLCRSLQKKSFHWSASAQIKKPLSSSSGATSDHQSSLISTLDSTEIMPNKFNSIQNGMEDNAHPQFEESAADINTENCLTYSLDCHDSTLYNHQRKDAGASRCQSRVKMFSSPISAACVTADGHESNATFIPSSNSNNSNIMHNKMSDILKRKIPPKRRSQASNRPKSRQDEIQKLYCTSKINEIDSNSYATSTRTRESNNARNSCGNKSSFLSSLNPARWSRQGFYSNIISKEPPNNVTLNLNKNRSNASLMITDNREKTRQWIHNQAVTFINRYSQQEMFKTSSSTSVMCRLSKVISKLQNDRADCIDALKDLKYILTETDISPFEVNYSGLIKSMLNFLTVEDGTIHRDDRLRAFLHVFAGLPLEKNIKFGLVPNIKSRAFRALVSKLNGCVTQLEQFPVKVHDVPSVSCGRSSSNALKFFNTHQLKCNLQRHPNCTNLRQWKGGTVKIDPLAMIQAIERYLIVRGYAGMRGEADDDSEDDIDDDFAVTNNAASGFRHKLQFLIGEHILPYNMTVYQAIKQFSSLSSDNSETEAEPEPSLLENSNVWTQHHTIYYRPIDEISHVASTNTIPINKMVDLSTSSSAAFSTKKKKQKCLSKHVRKKTDFWHDGLFLNMTNPITPFLEKTLLPNVVSVQDASLDALCLLRVLNALNRHWECLYGYFTRQNIINQTEFIHSKLTAKANRQLQDPLVIITGNVPHWLQQISVACPFVFSFETRLLLFYAISFDRDRALHRIFETAGDLNSTDTTERVAPRLDRCKRVISRKDILKQAEQIIQDIGHSKSLLEIQYEDEVGTGLGPTLEFYALVSAELQRSDLCLWTDSDSYTHISSTPAKLRDIEIQDSVIGSEFVLNATDPGNNSPKTILSSNVYDQRSNEHTEMELSSKSHHHHVSSNYINTSNGLFPLPLGRSAKLTQVLKTRAKFKFLGKFIAKAVMDSRMVDLPFSIPFYRWLLSEEHLMDLGDLVYIAPEIHGILLRLQDVVNQRGFIQADQNISESDKIYKVEMLNLDGCLIADLGLNFVLPGYSNIELRRGGRYISVTIHNLHQYISLVTHWFLVEGVQKQFESIREGFNTVFPLQNLKYFYPEELEDVFCGSNSLNYVQWDTKMLHECCKVDHGYSHNSKAIQFLFDILSSYSIDEQRNFLQFVTGSPRLPTGGFKSLNPPLTIVRKTFEADQNPNDYLPSVMTCVNYLKLPEYTTCDIMRDKLKIAANEGSRSFHLS